MKSRPRAAFSFTGGARDGIIIANQYKISKTPEVGDIISLVEYSKSELPKRNDKNKITQL